MTKVYLIRHAEAEGNLYRVFHGQTNSSVTDLGLQQIQALSKRFENEHIDKVYASDLLRTQITAKALTVPKNLPLQLEPRFREVKMGCWEGVNFGTLYYRYPTLLQQLSEDPENWYVDGAERRGEYAKRFLEALTQAARENDGKTIAIFSHAMVMRGSLQTLFAGRLPEDTFDNCDNTAVTLLQYENGAFQLVYANDSSHLPVELSTLKRQNHRRQDGSKLDYSLWFQPAADAPEAFAALMGSAYSPNGEAVDRLVMFHDTPVGFFAMSQPAEGQAGRLLQMVMTPEYQAPMYWVQLLGNVVFFYRKSGVTMLEIPPARELQPYRDFFLVQGFREKTTAQGPVLEKNIDLYRFM